MKTKRLNPVLVIIFSLLLLAPVFPDISSARTSRREKAKSSETRMPSVPGAMEHIEPEPVFKGKAYIFEAGCEHPLSVVLVHGLGNNASRDWKYLIPELSSRYHVVTFDLPGFGRSSRKNLLYSPSLYADFVHWVISRYVKGPYVLIGHSMGGAVVLKYAAVHPENISKLILVDVAGILHRLAFTKYALRIRSPEGSSWIKKLGSEVLNALTFSFFDDMENKLDPGNLDKILESPVLRRRLLGGDPAKIAGMALIQEDFSAVLDRVKTPALIIWGADDPAAPLRTGKLLNAKLPGSRLVTLPDAGHAPMLDKPDIFNRLVLEEIASESTANGSENKSIQTAPDRSRTGECRDRTGVLFNGGYGKILVENCKQVRIVDADALSVEISGSDVIIENSTISGREVGLDVVNSQVTLTSVKIDAETAILVSGSSLDLAGVELIGTKAAIAAGTESELLFSVSKAKSPFTSGYLHGKYVLGPDRKL